MMLYALTKQQQPILEILLNQAQKPKQLSKIVQRKFLELLNIFSLEQKQKLNKTTILLVYKIFENLFSLKKNPELTEIYARRIRELLMRMIEFIINYNLNNGVLKLSLYLEEEFHHEMHRDWDAFVQQNQQFLFNYAPSKASHKSLVNEYFHVFTDSTKDQIKKNVISLCYLIKLYENFVLGKTVTLNVYQQFYKAHKFADYKAEQMVMLEGIKTYDTRVIIPPAKTEVQALLLFKNANILLLEKVPGQKKMYKVLVNVKYKYFKLHKQNKKTLFF